VRGGIFIPVCLSVSISQKGADGFEQNVVGRYYKIAYSCV